MASRAPTWSRGGAAGTCHKGCAGRRTQSASNRPWQWRRRGGDGAPPRTRRWCRDQAQLFPGCDGPRERSYALVGNLLIDHHTQQAGRQLGVARLLADQRGRRTDRQLVELAGGGTVTEPADGPCRHSQRVNAMQPLRTTLDRTYDPVDIDRLQPAIALANSHERRPLVPVVSATQFVPVVSAATAMDVKARSSSTRGATDPSETGQTLYLGPGDRACTTCCITTSVKSHECKTALWVLNGPSEPLAQAPWMAPSVIPSTIRRWATTATTRIRRIMTIEAADMSRS